MAHAYDLSGDPGLEQSQGTVYKKTIDRYDVHIDGRIVRCELATSLRKELAYTRAGPSSERRRVREAREDNHSDPVAVGDHVLVQETGDGTGLIRAVLPRRNQLSRRTAVPRPGAHAFEQVVAANLDQVAPVFAVAQPAPHWAMLDRYLASSELAGLPALIIITKIDLLAVDGQGDLDREIRTVASTYRQVGYPVLWVSAASGEGLPELATALHGKVTALVGKSGVGKTTLLNALQPGLGRARVGGQPGDRKRAPYHLVAGADPALCRRRDRGYPWDAGSGPVGCGSGPAGLAFPGDAPVDREMPLWPGLYPRPGTGLRRPPCGDGRRHCAPAIPELLEVTGRSGIE